MDWSNVQSVGIQISADGNRVWVCVDGGCILRIKGIQFVAIQDDRSVDDTKQAEGGE